MMYIVYIVVGFGYGSKYGFDQNLESFAETRLPTLVSLLQIFMSLQFLGRNWTSNRGAVRVGPLNF